ncbi:MAG: hypothetical protein FD144_4799 [Rhodospirillaceae bacterium]|nr:MAG: hypothetical protein FD144_4799 [Rhodospirillaceae bacterium]
MDEERLVAFLNFDIVGYTALMAENQPAAMTRRNALFKTALAEVAAVGGRVVKTNGDEAFIVFPTVRGAAKVAVALNRPDGLPLRFGISLGDITVQDSDVLGHNVNTACRLQKMTASRTILATQAVAEQVYVYPDEFTVIPAGEMDLKGIGLAAVFSISAGPKPASLSRALFRSAEIANEQLTRLLSERDAEAQEMKHELQLTQDKLKDTRRLLSLTRALRVFEQHLAQCEERYKEAQKVEDRWKADSQPEWLEELSDIQNRWQVQHADPIADAYQEIDAEVPPFPIRLQYLTNRNAPYNRKFFDEAPAFHAAVRKSINAVWQEIMQLRTILQH